jgi:hypothetical protein
VGAAPNQLFCWAQGGSPFLDYAAAPTVEANSTMAKLGPAIMDAFNPLLATNRMGKWERAKDSDGVVWSRSPIIAPWLKSIALPEGYFLFAGLSPLAVTNTPPPSGTLQELFNKSNIAYFDRELTGPRVDASMFVSQLFRVIFRREQLPPEANAVKWLKAAGPMLGNSSTTLTKTGPAELSLSRSSTLGLTALELQLMADWMESSQFPLRLHSAVAKLPALPARRAGGNGASAK